MIISDKANELAADKTVAIFDSRVSSYAHLISINISLITLQLFGILVNSSLD